MNQITPNEKVFLQLLLRSPDRGEGWRTVSDVLWPLVQDFSKPEFVEVGDKRVRLTPTGLTICDYL